MVKHTQRRSTEEEKIRMHSIRNGSGVSILEISKKTTLFFKRLNSQHQAIQKIKTRRRKPITTPLSIRHLARMTISSRDSTPASIAKQTVKQCRD